MKKMKKLLSLTLFLVIIFGISFPISLKAESIEMNTYTHKWEEDTLINSFDQLENSFYVSDNMDISDFIVNLKIKTSPTLIEDLSSISILLNNTPVHSVNIKDLDESGLLNIKVPNKLIRPGINSILVKGFLKSTRDRCEFNPDINWIIIEKDSSFTFRFIRKDSEYIKDIFENTYYPDGLNGFVQLAVPDEVLEGNYSQISSISALLGYIHRDKETDLKIKTLKYSKLNETNRESIIIGSPEQIRAFNEDLLTDKEWEDAKENGFIGIRKISEKPHFLLISSNEPQLKTLINILQHKPSLSQIKDKNYILGENKIISRTDFIMTSSFKNLGYESFSRSGSGIKEFNYYLTIPANQMLTSDNKFLFHYNYSALLKNDNAYLTVEINDKKLFSKEILKESDTDNIEFSIPPKYFDQIGFNISLKFNLAPEEETCLANNYDDLWIEVDTSNSYFNLKLDNRQEYSLINAQGLFQDSNGFIDGTITIDDFDHLSFDSICNFSAYLGRVSQGVNKLSFTEGDEAVDERGVLIGLSSSLLIKSEVDNFQIQPSKNGNLINKDLFIQNTDALGLVGISLDNNKLLITANNENQLNLTIQNYQKIISPNKSIILQDGETIDFFNNLEDIKILHEETKGVGFQILIAGSVLVAFTIIVFLLYFKKIK